MYILCQMILCIFFVKLILFMEAENIFLVYIFKYKDIHANLIHYSIQNYTVEQNCNKYKLPY